MLSRLKKWTARLGLLAALAVLPACNMAANRISFPSSSVWNEMATLLSSPYNDLTVVATGDGLSAAIEGPDSSSGNAGAYVYCQLGDTFDFSLFDPATLTAEQFCEQNKPGSSVFAVRYGYGILVRVDRQTFLSGSVQVVSAANGVQQTLEFAVSDATQQVQIVATQSPGFLPLPWKNANPDDMKSITDSFAAYRFAPHDPNFADAYHGAEGSAVPVVICEVETTTVNDVESPTGDTVLINLSKNINGVFPCGTLDIKLSMADTALNVKSEALADTQTLRSTASGRDAKELDKAIADMAAATDEDLWTDEDRPDSCEGDRTFKLDAKAAERLRHLLDSKKTALDAAELQQILTDLVGANKLVAEKAIADATEASVDSKRMTRALKALHKGDIEASKNKPEHAIRAYRKAWAVLFKNGACDDGTDNVD